MVELPKVPIKVIALSIFVTGFGHISVSEKPGSEEKIHGGGNLIKAIHGFRTTF
jgi:hypothetical protein